MDPKSVSVINALHKWAYTLDNAARLVGEMGSYVFDTVPAEGGVIEPGHELMEQLRPAVYRGTIGIHMVTIALRQIERHMAHLEGTAVLQGEVERLAGVFRDAVKSAELKDLRNVLEHGDEYMTGGGNKPELVQDPSFDWPAANCVEDRIITISVFGRVYYVRDAIMAALDFASSLPEYGADIRIVVNQAKPRDKRNDKDGEACSPTA